MDQIGSYEEAMRIYFIDSKIRIKMKLMKLIYLLMYGVQSEKKNCHRYISNRRLWII